MSYRPDIDGLRAIAVLAVVAFHLGVPGLAGGYVGVDVFFVISGYLITALIQGRLEAGSFSVGDFYRRRIRRLLPPLVATVVFTLFGAAVVMTPLDMSDFARSALAAVFSVSNILFYLESGYWDAASELKPLLHTWSLGVEEQFYLFWPTLLMLLFAWRERVSFVGVMAITTVAGFALCVWFTTVDQPGAFYLLPFRVFEFSAGALVIPLSAALARRDLSGAVTVAAAMRGSGLLLIAMSVVFLTNGSRFPGWGVLFPALGAALCLFQPTASKVPGAWLLENRVALWLGRVSYSMYLVHWPIIVLYRYETDSQFTVASTVLLAVAIVLCTCLLHYGVERRFYTRAGYRGHAGPQASSPGSLRGIAIAAAVVALLSSTAWLGDGWAWRFPSDSQQFAFTVDQLRKGMQARFTLSEVACRVDYGGEHPYCDGGNGPVILVIGNSHEVDGYNIVDVLMEDTSDVELIMFGNLNSCGDIHSTATGLASDNTECDVRLTALFSPSMLDRLRSVVYSAHRPFARNKEPGLVVLRALKALNPDVPLVTLGSYIQTKRRCSYYVTRSQSTRSCVDPDNVAYFDSNPEKERLYDQFMRLTDFYIDKIDLLCEGRELDACPTETEEGIPAFFDESHLSLEFSQMFARRYRASHPEIVEILLGR